MFLSEILNQLEHGELSQVAIGGDEIHNLAECNLHNVLPHINLGLAELYKRFPLRIEDVVVNQYDHIQTYYLDRKYARTNIESREPIKYIHDSIYQPFTGNVNKIEFIYNELGEELFINDDTEYWSLYTPTYNSVQVPWPDKANQMIVHYRASHPEIKLKDLNPDTEEVYLPPGYLEALLNYIAARIFTNMNSDGQIMDGNNYMQKFEQSCAKITELNLMNNDHTTNIKLDRANWV